MISIGIDTGQKREPTALAVAETDRRQSRPDRTDLHYLIRHLERLPLGTSFPRVAAEVARVSKAVHQQTGTHPRLYVDATGLGQPVVDLIRSESPGCRIFTVYFTYGDRRSEEDQEIILGKGHLVCGLQTLLQARRLHLPRSAEADVLAQELLAYEVRVQPDANERYGAFRVGRHDDLVTALGLAVQGDDRPAMYASLVRWPLRARPSDSRCTWRQEPSPSRVWPGQRTGLPAGSSSARESQRDRRRNPCADNAYASP